MNYSPPLEDRDRAKHEHENVETNRSSQTGSYADAPWRSSGHNVACAKDEMNDPG